MGAEHAVEQDGDLKVRTDGAERKPQPAGLDTLAGRLGALQGTAGNAAVAAAIRAGSSTGAGVGTSRGGPLGYLAGTSSRINGTSSRINGTSSRINGTAGKSEANQDKASAAGNTTDDGRPGPDAKIPEELRNRLAQDAFYEQLTHNHAYENSGELSKEGKALMATKGYRPLDSKVVKGKTEEGEASGFQLRYYLAPEGSGQESIIAFRGTEASFSSPQKLSEFFRDLGADADPGGIGLRQYLQSAGEIEQVLRMAQRRSPGKVVVTGQSLGGSLAQICASINPELINKVVTFQAPGINRDLVERYKQRTKGGKHGPETTHYKTKRDFVHTAGEDELPGTSHWASAMPKGEDRTRWGVGAHTAYTVTPLASQEGVLPPDFVPESDEDDARYEGSQVAGEYKRPRYAEATRKAVGHQAGMATHGFFGHVDRQIQLQRMQKGWLAAKDAMERQPGPEGEKAARQALEKAGLHEEMQVKMLEQLRAAQAGRKGKDWEDEEGQADREGGGASGSW